MPLYYFTKPDPDYAVKGSRDPLGFQVIWQHQGKRLISYLSTVSINIRDFQILCLAQYLYQGRPAASWGKFFFRFEQAMAYVRLLKSPNEGFNGVEKVRKNINAGTRVSISNSTADEILSNQRAYGIWGKYTRPYTDIDFVSDKEFVKIYSEKLAVIYKKPELERLVNKIIESEKTILDHSQLTSLGVLLNVTASEKKFFDRKILKFEQPDNFQNRLYDFVASQRLPKDFKLYSFLDNFEKYLNKSEIALKSVLRDIRFTEQILCPLARIFRYIQQKPLWSKDAIENDDFILRSKQEVKHSFLEVNEHSKVLNHFVSVMMKSNWQLVEDLVKRNDEVSAWRGGAPWMKITNSVLEVHHSEGQYNDNNFNPSQDADNSYFIETYISLFKQLHAV